ncbi:alginate lyase/Heparinase II/III-like protein [Anaerolinea thermolimosa]|uniref:alginate lyase family protein n=1 Tax=Anaerolinea thermolimosa TaxID=229919 RepID=UPI000785B7E0|nr:alginate lyase family protein [Anaerolinea thermolimosa]GAP07551.1 alginate lyase/Heparinase II/III-like protein [Anaerolinea thermolimosa]
MNGFQSAVKYLKVARVLGLRAIGWYLVYQAGLRSGHYRRSTPSKRETRTLSLRPAWPLPPVELVKGVLGDAGCSDLLAEADEITEGRIRLFGGPSVNIDLAPPSPLHHWTDYEQRKASPGAEDVKLIWEPARFGFAYTLGRAYHITHDERYAEAFWTFFEAFDQANPPNLGPNWVSAQEVALRLLALAFASTVFSTSPHSTSARQVRLAQSVAEHASRIPHTLPYARAQQNNHHLSEALGLYMAGVVLLDHPLAARCRELGWRELNQALQSQIEPDGTYTQHSTNYHRLMLQAALLADTIRRSQQRAWPSLTLQRLQAASGWLYHHLDLLSGRVPNLGHNDGAYILPLASGGFSDFRPTIQACARAFGSPLLLPPGPWDELSLWLGLENAHPAEPATPYVSPPSPMPRLTHPGGKGWASLRAVHLKNRPSHADQLHVEIWFEGENLAMDAGTYRYNALPPWDNALACTAVHNTVTVDDIDQMTRAGKFLWVDLAQAKYTALSPQSICAEQDGYHRLGIRHRREIFSTEGGWMIHDDLLPSPSGTPHRHRFTLHWLLPDWPCEMPSQNALTLYGKSFLLTVQVTVTSPVQNPGEEPLLQLIRASESLVGPPSPAPIFGWVSPTYNLRQPALSLRLSLNAMAPVHFTTSFIIQNQPTASARRSG